MFIFYLTESWFFMFVTGWESTKNSCFKGARRQRTKSDYQEQQEQSCRKECHDKQVDRKYWK